VAAWTDSLASGNEQFPSTARKQFLNCLKQNGVGPAVQAESFTIQLPVNLFSFEKKTVVSSGWKDIHAEISPFNAEAEKIIIESLISDISSKFAIQLGPELCYDRQSMPADTIASSDPCYVIVAASHARNLAAQLEMAGHSTRLLSTPSWRPNTQTVSEALADLHIAISEHSNIAAVMYFCLDAAAFYAMTEDSIIPIAKDGKGDYHVFGSLVTAPADMFSKSLKTCLPLFSAVNATTKIVLSPLPKYWQERCCEDEEHVSNINDSMFFTLVASTISKSTTQVSSALLRPVQRRPAPLPATHWL
jgi:hypothetical protein